jgi:succinate dehydrogenase / fumarate reductase cytochrome b subunit
VAATSKPYSSSVIVRPPDGPLPAPARTLTLAGARRSYVNSSIGTKVLVGTTGLLLFLYLLLHIGGNLLVFFGPATFNGYSYILVHNPLIVPVEIGLTAVFVLHIYKAATNWWANRRARPVSYYKAPQRLFGWGWARHTSRKSISSSTMIFSGLIILFFVLIHVRQFRFGSEYVVTDPKGVEIRDLYRTEWEVFSNLFNVVFYELAVIVVATHIWHGFSSAFNSLGADHPRYTPWVLRAGKIFSILIGAGFVSIPIWVYAFGVRP